MGTWRRGQRSKQMSDYLRDLSLARAHRVGPRAALRFVDPDTVTARPLGF